MQATGDATDHRPGKRRRLRRLLEAAREHLLEGRGRAPQPLQARRTRHRRLEHDQAGAVPVVLDRAPELIERRAEALLEIALGLAVGGADARGGARGEQVERRQEALLPVLELLVEGAPRDAGEADHLLDAGARIAVGGNSLDHRTVHARALIEHDLLRLEPVRPARKPLIQGGERRPVRPAPE